MSRAASSISRARSSSMRFDAREIVREPVEVLVLLADDLHLQRALLVARERARGDARLRLELLRAARRSRLRAPRRALRRPSSWRGSERQDGQRRVDVEAAVDLEVHVESDARRRGPERLRQLRRCRPALWRTSMRPPQWNSRAALGRRRARAAPLKKLARASRPCRRASSSSSSVPSSSRFANRIEPSGSGFHGARMKYSRPTLSAVGRHGEAPGLAELELVDGTPSSSA